MNEADVLGHSRGVWHELGNLHTVLVVVISLEGEHARCNRKPVLTTRHGGDALPHPNGIGKVSIKPLAESGLVIEHVNLTRSALHVHIDDAFRFWCVVR